jgi:hypothetical protein
MSSLPKNKAAVDFLQIWKENGPWVLTAISVDRKQIDTTTFSTENIDELGHWLETYNGVRNCYFHVNPCIRPMTRKAEREDILSLDWLHVDIDPRAGEPLYDERIRALDLLRRPPGQIPLPTIVIFSGGGYQGFWKLAKPIPLNGSLELAEEYKLYNKQLEVAFGGDNCHNVDRIMRLPGTVNIPDPKKEKKGRVRITAELVDDFPARQYLITDFTKSLKTQLAAEVGAPFAQIDVGISSNANRLNTVDELDTYNVPTRIKVIIVAGRNPDEGVKAKDDSRSAWCAV